MKFHNQNSINLKLDKRLFNEVYLPYVYDYTNRIEVYYGGAGSGKSRFVSQKLILKALKYPNRKILIVRKVGSTLKDSVFTEIKTVLTDWKLYQYVKINKTDMNITLPNNAIFLFKSLDDPEKIKSISGIDDIWIEEATELTLDDYSQLNLRLRSRNPFNQIIMTFNPVSKANWVYKMFFENGYNEENTMILHTNYTHNKFLPQTYIDHLMEQKEFNPTYFEIYALGKFCTLDKLVYNNWQELEFDYKDIVNDKNRIITASCGLDFGYVNDINAFTCLLIDTKNKELFIYDEWGNKGMTNDEIYKVINDKGYSKEVIIADCSEQKSIEELKRLGLRRIKPCSKGKDSVIHGIQFLQQYKIYVHPSCTGTIEELENYTWKKDKGTNEYINVPIDMYNHYLDSIRYGVQIVMKDKTKMVNKRAFRGL